MLASRAIAWPLVAAALLLSSAAAADDDVPPADDSSATLAGESSPVSPASPASGASATLEDAPPGASPVPAGDPRADASEAADPPKYHRRPQAAAVAVVPGLVVHGAGHYVLGETRTANRLLLMEGIGLGGVVGSLAGLAVTGASRRAVGPLALMTIAGGFLMSTFADLYGVLAPADARGEPLRTAPWVQTEVGVRYVYDPNFRYRSFLVEGLDLRRGGFKLAPKAWFALNDDNARLEGTFGYRFLGPRPAARGASAERATDGSYLDLDFGALHHRYGTERFTMTGAEVMVRGRLDMARIGRTLRGSFSEVGGGLGLQSYRYLGRVEEANTLLLGWFAWGFYVGAKPSGVGGEVMTFYDHRHDDLAGGLKMNGLGSGVPGHFGARGTYFFLPNWGVSADARIGSAFVGGLSLLFREGARR